MVDDDLSHARTHARASTADCMLISAGNLHTLMSFSPPCFPKRARHHANIPMPSHVFAIHRESPIRTPDTATSAQLHTGSTVSLLVS